MSRNWIGISLVLPALACTALVGQEAPRAALPPLPAPLSVPKPGPATDAPYAPQAIVAGGVVVPLYPAGSPFLKADRVREAEVYNMSQVVPGRISSIVNIHNPSIEVHVVERGLNTGAAIILAAGGGHNTLNVGGESADFVHSFYNFGINTIILRNRLRKDGYIAEKDAVNDALQAIRLVRAYAKEWNIDPKKIGIMGFSAGAELSAPAAVLFEEFDKKNSDPSDPLAGISSRPDFAGIVYPGPSPFARNRTAPPIPRNAPPAFLACPGTGDRVHAIWAIEYYSAMLTAGIPNIEMHLYGNGTHGGGQTDRSGIPLGTWQLRFIEWFRDLGFLQKPGIETKAAKDIETFLAQPVRVPGQGRPSGAPR
jgi:acetyl esterase/lipase